MKREKSTLLEFNLNELIEQQINLFHTQCETKNVEVRFAPTRSYQLSHDKNGLSVIIRNILSNAIKFSHPASHIDIALADEHQQIIIRIADYGVGMKEEQLLQFHRGELQHTTGTLCRKWHRTWLFTCSGLLSSLECSIGCGEQLRSRNYIYLIFIGSYFPLFALHGSLLQSGLGASYEISFIPTLAFFKSIFCEGY
jgi:hypothetical protein